MNSQVALMSLMLRISLLEEAFSRCDQDPQRAYLLQVELGNAYMDLNTMTNERSSIPRGFAAPSSYGARIHAETVGTAIQAALAI